MGLMVRPLSAENTIRIWEAGGAQHPLDRALLCLAFGCPEVPTGTLATWPIGLRDAALLALRDRTFGPQMASQATCPHCSEPLEFTLNVADILLMDLDRIDVDQHLPGGEKATYPIQTDDGLSLSFRLPNSLDLAAIAALPAAEARDALAKRCLLGVERVGQAVSPEALTEAAIATLSQHLAEADPQAEILLNLQCPACAEPWQVLFDIAAFLWEEIQVQARRVLLEVHQLARGYGWREADILALSSTRRQYYLELVS